MSLTGPVPPLRTSLVSRKKSMRSVNRKAVLTILITLVMLGSAFALLATSQPAMATSPPYTVEFNEQGLSGVPWTVTFDSITHTTYGNSTTFAVANGTYSYTISTGSGFTPSISSGSITVAGAKVLQNITFSVPTYAVTFTVALPSPAEIIFAGQASAAGATNPVFDVANGTYGYHISYQGVTGYEPVSGSVTVNGSAVSKTLTLTSVPAAKTYSVNFLASGVPATDHFVISTFLADQNGSDAVAPLVTSAATGASSTSVSLSNGTYDYYAAVNVTGYYSTNEFGTFTVSGSSVTIPTISFVTGAYPVTVSETGLTGEIWGSTFDSMTLWSSGTSMVFSVLSGTYTYSIASIPDFSVSPASGSVSVSAASNVPITFIAVHAYPVTFSEKGLPIGTKWYIDQSGLYNSSTTSSLKIGGSFDLPNGTYSYSIGTSPGFVSSPASGKYTVNGAAVRVNITFTDAIYTVNFVPKGLYTWASFNTTLNGFTQTAKDSSMAFYQVNGTYTFDISAIPTHFTLQSAATAKIYINGSLLTETVKFLAENFTLNFTETSLPQYSNWTVTIDGVSHSSVTPYILVNLPDGSYTYTVASPTGFIASPDTGSVVVNNASVFTHIAFSPINTATYTVTFFESGLASGAAWSVTFNGAAESSTTNTIAFTEPNGTYTFSLSAPSGYTVSPSSGALVVQGKEMVQDIAFAVPNTFTVTFQESGLASGAAWSVTLNGHTETSTTNSVVFSGINGSYSYIINNVSGYKLLGNSKGTGNSAQGISMTFVANTPTSIWGTYEWYIIGGVVVVFVLYLVFRGGEKDEEEKSGKGRYK